jgi:hypothetical protein
MNQYNAGHTYTGEEREDHRRRLHVGGVGCRATRHRRREGGDGGRREPKTTYTYWEAGDKVTLASSIPTEKFSGV